MIGVDLNGRSAVFSDDREYRYLLTITETPDLLEGGRRILFVMLNPSTADELADDPTVRRCRGFGRALGCSVLEVVNLFALRSPDPRMLARVDDPIGPANDAQILAAARRADLIIGAWGSHGTRMARASVVTSLLEPFDVHALKTTKHGQPCHPLYLPASCRPFVWSPAGSATSWIGG